MNLRDQQKRVWENKIKHNFNLTNVNLEFCLLYGEVGEAYDAWNKSKGKEEVSLELADIGIYLMSVAQMLDIDLEDAIDKKMAINEKREYYIENGVWKKKEN